VRVLHTDLPVLAIVGTPPVPWLLAGRLCPGVTPGVRLAGTLTGVPGARTWTFRIGALPRLPNPQPIRRLRTNGPMSPAPATRTDAR
jgi:hypothetical protein